MHITDSFLEINELLEWWCPPPPLQQLFILPSVLEKEVIEHIIIQVGRMKHNQLLL